VLKSNYGSDESNVGIVIPLQSSLATLLMHYMRPMFSGFSHFLVIISDFRLVKEEKMFRYLNIFLNYLVDVSNGGSGV
jgi:hypothetical protein